MTHAACYRQHLANGQTIHELWVSAIYFLTLILNFISPPVGIILLLSLFCLTLVLPWKFFVFLTVVTREEGCVGKQSLFSNP